eukprot:maker-scaffold_12-snap-gene-7.54-mRNA-1 protein AED:0.02 eAED:0.02 QI:117/0.5/0.33/1/1/1/3/0/619
MSNPAEIKAQLMEELLGPNGDYALGPLSWKSNGKKVDGIGPKTLGEFYTDVFSANKEEDFIVYQEERFTYAQVYQEVMKEQIFYSKYGVTKGERVIICSRNYPEWMVSFIAATWCGGVIVPVNSLWKTEEIEYAVRDSAPKVMIVEGAQFKKLVPILDGLIRDIGVKIFVYRYKDDLKQYIDGKNILDFHEAKNVLVRGVSHTKVKALESEVKEKQNALKPEDMFAIFYTSGTTGNPKGVVLTHLGAVTQVCLMLIARDMAAKVANMTGAAPSGQQGIVCAVPLFHVTGSHHNFLTIMANGGKIITMYKWDAGNALKLIEREKVQRWTGVPTMVQDLMEHPDFEKTDTSSLTSIGGGGAFTPASQYKKTVKKFKNATPSTGYGLSETNGAVSWIDGEDVMNRPASCGKPLPWVMACLVDPDEKGPVVKALDHTQEGVTGELLVKTSLNLKEYWRKPEKTAEALVEVEGQGYGWFRTGDIAKLDSENYIFLLDRSKDLIIRGGENISCAEVESALFLHPDVLECCVFAIKDERLGEEVGAVVVTKRGITLNQETEQRLKKEILEICDKSLAKFKTPYARHIFFQDANNILPRGGTGKILKREVREKINALLETQKPKASL